MANYILAYDLGTGGNKASLYDEVGKCLANAFVPYDTYYPRSGWHEQRPMDWWNAVVQSTNQLLATTRIDRHEIACCGISGHSLGVVPLDRYGTLLRSGKYDAVSQEIKAIVDVAEARSVKVILEVSYLTEDEIKKACELCIKAGAAFVKTGTGWTPTGTTLEVISLITSFVGNAINVKASGGIRNLDTFIAMYKMGVTRFGISVQSSMNILHECAAHPGGVVTL